MILYVYYRSARLVSRLFFVESGLLSVYRVDGCGKVLPSCRTSRVFHPYCRLCGGCRAVCASWEGMQCGVCKCGRFFVGVLDWSYRSDFVLHLYFFNMLASASRLTL